MSTRDELASLTETLHAHRELWDIRGCFAGCSCGWDGFQKHHRRHQADAILAAGYSRPRVVETIEQLDTLPEGAVIYSANAFPLEKASNEFRTQWTYGPKTVPNRAVQLPATVLHMPEEQP